MLNVIVCALLSGVSVVTVSLSVCLSVVYSQSVCLLQYVMVAPDQPALLRGMFVPFCQGCLWLQSVCLSVVTVSLSVCVSVVTVSLSVCVPRVTVSLSVCYST